MANEVGHGEAEAVQEQRAMAVQDALGIAGRSGGVASCRGGVFIEAAATGTVRRGCGFQQLFVIGGRVVQPSSGRMTNSLTQGIWSRMGSSSE